MLGMKAVGALLVLMALSRGAAAQVVAGSFAGSTGGDQEGAEGDPIAPFGLDLGEIMSPLFDFQNIFNNHANRMAKFQTDLANRVGTYAYTAGDWRNAKAESSLTYDNVGSLQAVQERLGQRQQDLANRLASHVQSLGKGGHGAFAASSIGDGGTFQSAAVFPENPNDPNIVNRFDATGGGGDGGSKFYSVVSTSHSSNVNGQPVDEAETIVNDNGKITRYHAKNPRR